MIELTVIGVIIGGLFFLFLSVPLPVWAPATALWGVTTGFIVYRVVAAVDQEADRRKTEPLEAVPADSRHERTTQLLDNDGCGDVVAADMGWQEAVSDRVYDTVAMASVDLPDAEQREDLRATLFDVPSVAQSSDAFDKFRVLTDEDLAAARSETLLLDAIDPEEADDEDASTLDEDAWRRLRDSISDGEGRTLHE
jgi:hypothetical protein